MSACAAGSARSAHADPRRLFRALRLLPDPDHGDPGAGCFRIVVVGSLFNGATSYSLLLNLLLFSPLHPLRPTASRAQALVSSASLVSAFDSIPVLGALFGAILPSLVLTIFLAVLPAIIKAMCRAAGMVSASQVDLGLLTRVYIFQARLDLILIYRFNLH